jgi:hypothetical protein
MTPRKQEVVKFLESLVGQRFNTDTLDAKLSEHFNEDIKVENVSQGRIDSGDFTCDDDLTADFNLMFNVETEDEFGYFDIYMLPMRREGFDGSTMYITEVDMSSIKLHDTDYVLWDKANDRLVTFTDGEVVIYGDKEEAEIDCYGNEYVTKCTDLPEHHQEALKKQIEKYY